jgi:23S rRNA (adenine2503-C2)-methyltransferase
MIQANDRSTLGSAPEKLVSKLDGTTKLLFRFSGGAIAESVILSNKGRVSVCLSSQSGCACGCGFCATARLGFTRDLTASEIMEQFSVCAQTCGGAVDNIVFMGMGEPFLNWENVKKSVLTLSDQKGLNFPQKRMTVSTVGVVPGIRELAESDLKIKLAISLVTADARQRAEIVPMESKYPLREVLDAARYYCRRAKKMVFFEYILFGGLNDGRSDAEKLLALVKDLDCKINLIMYNELTGNAFLPSSIEKAKEFQNTIIGAGVRAYLRRAKGIDIGAACGQLAGRLEDGLRAGAKAA